MNSYNKVPADGINTARNELTRRQAAKLARFPSAFIALDRNGKNIVVLDEGPKPEVTAMCSEIFRMNVVDRGNVRHGSITWHAPSSTGKIGTHNKN